MPGKSTCTYFDCGRGYLKLGRIKKILVLQSFLYKWVTLRLFNGVRSPQFSFCFKLLPFFQFHDIFYYLLGFIHMPLEFRSLRCSVWSIAKPQTPGIIAEGAAEVSHCRVAFQTHLGSQCCSNHPPK